MDVRFPAGRSGNDSMSQHGTDLPVVKLLTSMPGIGEQLTCRLRQ
jgi:hypothetical protein